MFCQWLNGGHGSRQMSSSLSRFLLLRNVWGVRRPGIRPNSSLPPVSIQENCDGNDVSLWRLMTAQPFQRGDRVYTSESGV